MIVEEAVLVNFRGHNGCPDEFVESSTLDRFWKHMVEQAAGMFTARRQRLPSATYPQSEYLNSCSLCGESVIIEETSAASGKVVALKPCEYPNGFLPFDVTIDVPSGEMIIGNDFRELWDYKRFDGFNVNSIKGKIGMTQAYEKEVGMAFLFVSNTSPDVFQNGPTKVAFTTEWDPETDERKVPGEGYVHKMQVITDLWWVCVMDHERYQTLRTSQGLKVGRNCGVLTVEPGLWSFRYDPMAKPEDDGFKCFGQWNGIKQA